jgi:hypothetical protein
MRLEELNGMKNEKLNELGQSLGISNISTLPTKEEKITAIMNYNSQKFEFGSSQPSSPVKRSRSRSRSRSRESSPASSRSSSSSPVRAKSKPSSPAKTSERKPRGRKVRKESSPVSTSPKSQRKKRLNELGIRELKEYAKNTSRIDESDIKKFRASNKDELVDLILEKTSRSPSPKRAGSRSPSPSKKRPSQKKIPVKRTRKPARESSVDVDDEIVEMVLSDKPLAGQKSDLDSVLAIVKKVESGRRSAPIDLITPPSSPLLQSLLPSRQPSPAALPSRQPSPAALPSRQPLLPKIQESPSISDTDKIVILLKTMKKDDVDIAKLDSFQRDIIKSLFISK